MNKKLLLLLLTVLFSLNHYSQSSFISQETDCSTGCSDLTIYPLNIEATLDYNVASIPFNPPSSFDGLDSGTSLNLDDTWSGILNLPFDFSFYGDTYSDLIIGGNGVVSFDTSKANGFNGWLFSETLPNNTNTALSDANIFGAAHDMDASVNGEIAYEVKGTAPFRVFVVSFLDMAHFSCNDLRTTQMIVLHETTNVVEVYLLNKPFCAGWNNGNAVVGIQNPEGTQAVVPPGRNTGAWSTQYEAWGFFPSGSILGNTYAWYDQDDVLISNNETINVCPIVDETFTGEITFIDPNTGLPATIEEDILITVDCPVILPNCDAVLIAPENNFQDADLEADLSWTFASQYVTGYRISIGTTSGGTDVADNVDVGLVTTYDPGTLEYETTYYVTIVPYNDDGPATGCVEESFSTRNNPIQIIDCAVNGVVNTVFCYDNADNRQFSFQTADGSQLKLFFNSGLTENNFDELIVLDSDGVTNINAETPYGVEGNLTGLMFTSTGDSITVMVSSDFNSTLCDDDPWDFTVSCLGELDYIEVNAFVDENSNSVLDDIESNFSEGVFTYEVNNDGRINYVNSSTGNFLIPNYDNTNTYDISFTMYDSYETCLNQTFTLVENVSIAESDTVHIDFPLTINQDCNDINVSLLSFIPPRPGQNYTNKMIIENLGSTSVSGTVEFTHDTFVTLVNVLNLDSGNTVTNTGTGFILDFNNLQPGDQEHVSIILNIPTNLTIGDLVTNIVVYGIDDIDNDNNESILTEAVVNSYDPNNKLESHGSEIPFESFTSEDYLYYTINFQNIGTAEAIDIRIEDLLNETIDASTFKMLSASHDYVLIRKSNKLVWKFNDINLPSESMDEPNSHGYVYFKIKPTSGYTPNSFVSNIADIYFDFNDRITTNRFVNEFVATLSVDALPFSEFSIYPNPANSTVNIQFNNAVAEDFSVSIYNLQGKLIRAPRVVTNENKITFNVSNLSQGMYFVELKSKTFKRMEKLIIE
ncbi:T9SS type A sorting domain-containing protein [Lacinutrix sp. MEBiC02595]